MNHTYLRGDMYYADLGRGIGSEQEGYRPVVIIQNNVGNKHSPTVIIASITSKTGVKAKLPTHYYIDAEDGLELPSMRNGSSRTMTAMWTVFTVSWVNMKIWTS